MCSAFMMMTLFYVSNQPQPTAFVQHVQACSTLVAECASLFPLEIIPVILELYFSRASNLLAAGDAVVAEANVSKSWVGHWLGLKKLFNGNQNRWLVLRKKDRKWDYNIPGILLRLLPSLPGRWFWWNCSAWWSQH